MEKFSAVAPAAEDFSENILSGNFSVFLDFLHFFGMLYKRVYTHSYICVYASTKPLKYTEEVMK